ncbi:hypothetical protein K8R03_00520 [Candidatus Kaiserbacteria bacterium]|nr:hypothetical protein [Candidatus Kaiserbacteria bacterium]
MLPYRDSKLTKAALGIFFLIIVGYAYFEARGFLYGPRISVPETVQEVHDPFILIKGTAQHISELRMNGKAIPVTESGDFEEPYLLTEGLNRIILDAKDKYGREQYQIMQVVYVAPLGGVPTATTTPALSTTTPATASSTKPAPQE